jgi:hypothetical protein
MADKRQSEVMGALPRTRPQRRSAKRPARPNGTTAPPAKPTPKRAAASAEGPAGTRRSPASKRGSTAKPTPARPTPLSRAQGRSRPSNAKSRSRSKADRLRQPPQPRGIPSQPRSPVPSSQERPEILGTVVQAAAELTEIGLSLGAQLLRRAVARLPRP